MPSTIGNIKVYIFLVCIELLGRGKVVLIPPPPPAQTWRLIPIDIYSCLSRVPSVYGDTTGIFLNTYYHDPDGTFIHDGISYSPVQMPLSIEPWVTEVNIAAARFHINHNRDDEVMICNGTLSPAYGWSAVGYIY